jgi:two-component system phosphate regulon sensor histidine kinase PhoR
MKLPIFWRLFWPVFLALAIFAAFADWTGRRAVRQAVLDETRASLLAGARGWQARLAAGTPPAALAEEARRLGTDRLTLIDAGGVVLADSAADSTVMENHRNRPEVAAVLAPGHGGSGEDVRRSATTSDEYFYLALPPAAEKSPVVRVARRLRTLEGFEQAADRRLRYGMTLALLVALSVATLFSWPLARALAQLKRGAEAAAAGDGAARWPHGGGREVQAVADAMASTAAQWRREVDHSRQLADERRAILDAIGDAVLGLDARGAVVYANPAAQRLHARIGLPPPAPGALYASLFPHPQLVESLRKPPGEETLRIERPVPPIFTLDVAGASTTAGGRLLILRDLSAEERLRAAKQDLTANVSHELKTPLAAILGAIETLEDETLSAEQRRQFVALASRHARRLKELLDDLLTLARLERPDLAREMSRFAARALAEEAAAAARPLADAAGVSLEITASGEFSGDRRQLHQALLNYLTNAVRHSPRGAAVTLEAGVIGGAARITVADRGAGVPGAIKARVFERFFRGDDARDRESGGTGLGLAIVKHVAQLHGGKAWVEDRGGGGARFILEWPQAERPD